MVVLMMVVMFVQEVVLAVLWITSVDPSSSDDSPSSSHPCSSLHGSGES